MYLTMLLIKAETNKGVEWKLELYFLATGQFELDTVLWLMMGMDYSHPNPSPKLGEGLPFIGVFRRLYRLKTPAYSFPPSWEGGKQGGWEPFNLAGK